MQLASISPHLIDSDTMGSHWDPPSHLRVLIEFHLRPLGLSGELDGAPLIRTANITIVHFQLTDGLQIFESRCWFLYLQSPFEYRFGKHLWKVFFQGSLGTVR